MSVAAPDVTARTEVATSGLPAAAPTGLEPCARGLSVSTARRTSAPLRHVAADNLLVCDMFFILRGIAGEPHRHALTLVRARPPNGCRLRFKRAPHNAVRRRPCCQKESPRGAAGRVTSPPFGTGRVEVSGSGRTSSGGAPGGRAGGL